MKVEIGPNSKEIIHIHKWDTWNMDRTLALIIHPMLIQLRDTNYSHPSSLTYKKWIKLQNKMIWSFEQLLLDSYWKIYSELGKEGAEKHEKKIQKGLKLFGKYYRHLWH